MCTTCASNYVFSQSGICLCPDGMRDNSTGCVSIMECDFKCISCLDRADICIECSKDANRTDNPPLCDFCPLNSTWMSDLKKCQPCAPQCRSCAEGEPSKCLECSNDSLIYPNPPPFCLSCPDGTYYDGNLTSCKSMKKILIDIYIYI